MSVALYAKKKNLLKVRGFTWCYRFLQEHKNHVRKMVFLARCIMWLSRKSKRVMKEQRSGKRKYKYGIEVPFNVKDATDVLDKQEGNNLWREAIEKERKAFEDEEVFEFLPKGSKPPEGYNSF